LQVLFVQELNFDEMSLQRFLERDDVAPATQPLLDREKLSSA